MIPLTPKVTSLLLRTCVSAAPLDYQGFGGVQTYDNGDVLSLIGSVRQTSDTVDIGVQLLMHCITLSPMPSLTKYLSPKMPTHSALWEKSQQREDVILSLARHSLDVYIAGEMHKDCRTCNGSGMVPKTDKQKETDRGREKNTSVNVCDSCHGKGYHEVVRNATTASLLRHLDYSLPDLSFTRHIVNAHVMPIYEQVHQLLIDACCIADRKLCGRLWREKHTDGVDLSDW